MTLAQNPHVNHRRLFLYLMEHLVRRLSPEDGRQFYISLLWPPQPLAYEDVGGAEMLDQAIERLVQGKFDFMAPGLPVEPGV
jgi:hypothetical protein